MEKRLILAIALSLLVLLTWSALTSKSYHIDNKEVIKKEAALEQPLPEPKPRRVQPETPTVNFSENGKTIVFSTDKLTIDFDEPRAAIKEIIFKDYRSHRVPLKYGLALADPRFVFKNQSLTDKEATFVYNGKDLQILKRFIFSNSNYYIELEIEIINKSSDALNTSIGLIPVILDFSKHGNLPNYQDITVALNGDVLHPNPRKDASWENIKFIGWRERYFCEILEPASPSYTLTLAKLNSPETQPILYSPELSLISGEKIKQKFFIYMGPQELHMINSINPQWSGVIYYGVFDFIARILLKLLGIIHIIVHNWGLSIILLSILIYLILYPLTLKQMHSMKAMQALQPRIEELRANYKDNPQRLNKEIMELYRKYKVNPFGGCLPMILQIPIFFALYQVLMRSAALKGAEFLWIKDLSEPDRLITLSHKLPFLGNEINILPILMAVAMFMQQKISSKSMSSASAEQQKLMLILFPVMFGFIFYRMPSGLVLYWFVNSSLMMLQQLLINRPK